MIQTMFFIKNEVRRYLLNTSLWNRKKYVLKIRVLFSFILGMPLSIEKADFSWEGTDGCAILRNIDLKINSGCLVAVVGPVGSGKSSLISAFLGEMYKLSGSVNTSVSIFLFGEGTFTHVSLVHYACRVLSRTYLSKRGFGMRL